MGAVAVQPAVSHAFFTGILSESEHWSPDNHCAKYSLWLSWSKGHPPSHLNPTNMLNPSTVTTQMCASQSTMQCYFGDVPSLVHACWECVFLLLHLSLPSGLGGRGVEPVLHTLPCCAAMGCARIHCCWCPVTPCLRAADRGGLTPGINISSTKSARHPGCNSASNSASFLRSSPDLVLKSKIIPPWNMPMFSSLEKPMFSRSRPHPENQKNKQTNKQTGALIT